MSGSISVVPDAGVIATLVRGSEVVTIHKSGTPKFALRAVVRACDRYGWKIRTLSSPVTVYRDLDGSRMQSSRGTEQALVAFPENRMLGAIGRMDLLA